MPTARDSVDALVAKRVEFLAAYQNADYAKTYEAFVRKVEQAESKLGKTLLAQNVARYLFKIGRASCRERVCYPV